MATGRGAKINDLPYREGIDKELTRQLNERLRSLARQIQAPEPATTTTVTVVGGDDTGAVTILGVPINTDILDD